MKIFNETERKNIENGLNELTITDGQTGEVKKIDLSDIGLTELERNQTSIRRAKELKDRLNAGYFSPLFNSQPYNRERYGRFELALELAEQLDNLADLKPETILEALEISINSTLTVYGKALEENTNFNPDQKD